MSWQTKRQSISKICPQIHYTVYKQLCFAPASNDDNGTYVVSTSHCKQTSVHKYVIGNYFPVTTSQIKKTHQSLKILSFVQNNIRFPQLFNHPVNSRLLLIIRQTEKQNYPEYIKGSLSNARAYPSKESRRFTRRPVKL